MEVGGGKEREEPELGGEDCRSYGEAQFGSWVSIGMPLQGQ